MIELLTQPLSIVLEMATVHTIILMKQDGDNCGCNVSGDRIEDPRESTLSTNIKEGDLDRHQAVIHQGQACCHKTWVLTRFPLPMKGSCADTVIADTPLPNLWNPAGAMASQLLKHQSELSTYYMSLTFCPPWRSRFPKLVETGMFLKQSPLEIVTFLSTKRLNRR